MPAGLLTRQFVTVQGRQGHYRRAGSGPPVVLLHTAPMSSRINVELMRLLADRYTVLALDRAGFGNSDHLHQEAPSIADYADGLIEVLDELRIPSATFVGHSTGTLVSLEVALRAPGRVQALVLENMPFLHDEERPDYLEHFGFGIVPQADGGHLARAWAATRDIYGYWPWYRPAATTWRDLDRPEPDALHQTVLDLMFAEPKGHLAYDAVWNYRGTVEHVAAVDVPTVLVGREDAALFTHLERLGTGLRPSCRIVRLPRPGGPEWPSSWWWSPQVARLVDELGPRGETPPAVEARPLPETVTRAYVPTSAGQLHVRRAGAAGGARLPLVLVPDAPRSTQALAALVAAEAEAGGRLVVAVDPPGVGDSDALSGEPQVDRLASALLEAAAALGLDRFELAGCGTGAVLAAATAVLAPERVASLRIEGVPLLSADERAAHAASYVTDLSPRADGTHLLAAWHRAYDGALHQPWFRTRRDTYLGVDPPAPDELHRATLDLLRAPGCQLVARAALCAPVRELLARVRVPATVAVRPDDPFAHDAAEAAHLLGVPAP